MQYVIIKTELQKEVLYRMPNRDAKDPVTLTPEQLLEATFPVMPGIFIAHNTTQQRYHIRMSDGVYQLAQRLFRGYENQNVYRDFQNGDKFSITIRPLESSGLYSLVTLAQHYIDRYCANEDNYA